jgi:hypothetical protein
MESEFSLGEFVCLFVYYHFNLFSSKFKDSISSTRRKTLSNSLRLISGAIFISIRISKEFGIQRNCYYSENYSNLKVSLPLSFGIFLPILIRLGQDVGHIALDLSVASSRKDDPTTPVKLRGSDVSSQKPSQQHASKSSSNGHDVVNLFLGDGTAANQPPSSASVSTTTAESTHSVTLDAANANGNTNANGSGKKHEKDHVAISF